MRAIHGVTTSDSAREDGRRDGERAARRAKGPRDEAGEHEREEGEPRVSENRKPRRRAKSERDQPAAALDDDQREQRHEREQEPVEDLPVHVQVVPDEEGVERCDRRADDADLERDDATADLEHQDGGHGGDSDVRDADDEPVPLEDLVEAGEEPSVEGLRVAGRPAGEEPEGAARDQRLREAVALLHELAQDLPALGEQDEQAGHDRR